MSEKGLIRVAVVYGGQSSEHSVSCVTGHAMMSNLDPARYQVIPVGITRDGTWVVGTTESEELTMTATYQPEVVARDEVRLAVNPHRAGQFHYVGGEHAGELYAQVDVVIPALHGAYGEDGTIQGLFELSHIPYVGCGVLASAAAMDKQCTKRLLADAGLSVARGVLVDAHQPLNVDDLKNLRLPLYVKPVCGGSSIGVSRVDSLDEVEAAVKVAAEEDYRVLIEQSLIGPEVEIGVLQRPDGELVASSPAQLVGTTDSDGGFYDFDTKYLANTVSALIPAPIDEATTTLMQEQAKQAFRAIGAEGLSRVDFFLTDEGPVINEINTMPGFTPISMYPQVFAADGITYPELLDTLIQRALARA